MKNKQNEFDQIKNKLNILSDNELSKYCSLFSGDKFKTIYNEITRRKELLLQVFRKENPGVPDYAIELKIGKNYSGRSDGDYEIQTINDKLWFIPGTCCDFGEDE